MLIRYPGSKDRYAYRIISMLDLSDRQLCEPFAGTAAVTFACLRSGQLDRAWLNDADPYLCALWQIIRDDPQPLCDRIWDYEPTPESFMELRDGEAATLLDQAFAMIVLHQTSYSGLGRMAGSPIGGMAQSGEYLIGCRWNRNRLIEHVSLAHQLMARADVTISCGDWSQCPTWTWYVDPPYYVAGPALYKHGSIDHQALSFHLSAKKQHWLLSYDNSPEVRDLYDWAIIESGPVTYLGTGRKQELFILPEPRTDVLF